jgi:hypothetical protein
MNKHCGNIKDQFTTPFLDPTSLAIAPMTTDNHQ